ncbi:hypothetical protein ACE1SV_02450 [Streptomyces sp. E-15]
MSYVRLLVIVIDSFTVPPGVVVAESVAKVRAAGAGSALALGARPKTARRKARTAVRPRRLGRGDRMAREARQASGAASAPVRGAGPGTAESDRLVKNLRGCRDDEQRLVYAHAGGCLTGGGGGAGRTGGARDGIGADETSVPPRNGEPRL